MTCIFFIFLVVTSATVSAQNSCNLTSYKDAPQAIAAQECLKKIISDLKKTLNETDRAISKHYDFLADSKKVSQECLIVEKNQFNKKKGLPHNHLILDEEVRFCEKVTKDIAVALTETSEAFDRYKKNTNLTKDAIQAAEIKYNQLSLFITQMQ